MSGETPGQTAPPKRKSERRQRSVMVSVRFSPAEIEAVQSRAAEAGSPVSGYLRALALKAAAAAQWRVIVNATGGNTGEPLGEQEARELAAALNLRAFREWFGVRPAPEVRTCYCGTTAAVVPGVFPHGDCDGSVPLTALPPDPSADELALAAERDELAAKLAETAADSTRLRQVNATLRGLFDKPDSWGMQRAVVSRRTLERLCGDEAGGGAVHGTAESTGKAGD